MSRYEEARKMYAVLGVDTEAALDTLKDVSVSVNCWQGDDLQGFDSPDKLSGGIQATGNYPGAARTPEELAADHDFAFSLMPGKKKLNLHSSYAVYEKGEVPDRSDIRPRHFKWWVDYAKERGLGIDFNPTFFSHPMVKNNLTLSSPDEEVRNYWIRHGKCCIRLAQYFADETGMPSVVNIWIPDGYKDYPADRIGPRARFKASLDEILTEPRDPEKVFVTLESKVFGIGLEAYTVGSAEFCLAYAQEKGITPLMDNGHYHPTETVSDKISSLLLFHREIGLHLTRPMRWDSDHVVLFEDETREIAKEIVRCKALDRVFIATDFFDGAINRISAWVTGVRSVQKALLYALLQPSEELTALQNSADFTSLMVVQEELKTAPFGDVWDEYLSRCGVEKDYLPLVKKYESDVLSKR